MATAPRKQYSAYRWIRTCPNAPLIALLPCVFGEAFCTASQPHLRYWHWPRNPPLPFARVGLAQPLAAEAFIPHRNHTYGTDTGAATPTRCLAPVWVWQSLWLQILFSAPHRTSGTSSGPAIHPRCFAPVLVYCQFGTAFGGGSLYSAPQPHRRHWDWPATPVWVRHSPWLQKPLFPHWPRQSRVDLAQPFLWLRMHLIHTATALGASALARLVWHSLWPRKPLFSTATAPAAPALAPPATPM